MCNDCNDTGFVWTRRADGTKEMVLCERDYHVYGIV